MLQQFNIDLESPCTCMTQDMSREFLQSCNPKKLWQFFNRGTQISKMMKQFEEAENAQAASKAKLTSTRTQIDAKGRDLKEQEKMIGRARQLKDIEDKVYKLNQELAWTTVCKQERAHEANKAKVLFFFFR